jgi:hypothetical protein
MAERNPFHSVGFFSQKETDPKQLITRRTFMNAPTMKKVGLMLLLLTVIAMGLGVADYAFSQTQRNPVLEFCTGTW